MDCIIHRYRFSDDLEIRQALPTIRTRSQRIKAIPDSSLASEVTKKQAQQQ